MKVLFLLGAISVFSISCGNCKETDSCSTKTSTADDDKESVEPEKSAVVNAEDLPECSIDTQNMTAYRRSTDKFFICNGNGWEELASNKKEEESSIAQISTFKLLWTEYMKIMPEESHLDYLCAAIIKVNPDFICLKGK